jgi:hypothetical protein
MSSAPKTLLESIVEDVRRLPTSHVETAPVGNSTGQNDGHLLGSVVVLDYLKYLTTRDLRNLFGICYDLNIPCCQMMYNYTYETQIEGYKYKQYLKSLLIPMLQAQPEKMRPMVIDINNLIP